MIKINTQMLMLKFKRQDCENKLATIKDQKTPLAFNKIIIKYHQALEQMINQRKELEYAKETLKEKDKNSSNLKYSAVGNGLKHGEVKSIYNKQILDNNKLQYNKVLAANTGFRLQLQEMIKIKEEFLRNLKLLQNERIRNRTRVDRLFEENTTLFQQREEYRLKLNLLRERLETTNLQGARDLQEYKRLLTADEKLNSFLEQKNQARLCLETSNRLGMQAQQGDQLMRQLVEEVEQETFQNLKNSNLKEIVEQYQHNLEQGYILYGLIAQKNVELDHLEDEISNKEKQVENQRSKIRPIVMSQNESTSIPNQEHAGASLMNAIKGFLLKFQSIINVMEVGTTLITDNSESSDVMLFDFQKVIAKCKSGSDKLIERSIQLLSAVATATDNRNSRDHLSDFTAMLPITTSRSSNSSN